MESKASNRMMRIRTFKRILDLFRRPKQLYALLNWPVFSFTSYEMVSALKKQGLKPQTVIDVGANKGQFTVTCANLFSADYIYSFEPIQNCVGKLENNISRYDNVKVFPFALGAKNGVSQFHVSKYSHSSSVLPQTDLHRKTFPNTEENNLISVQISTLDEVFECIHFKSPVLLKLDVQGFESQVLYGGPKTLQRIDYVILEASLKPLYEGELLFMDIVYLMEENGFRFSRPVGSLLNPKTEEILQIDALFVKK